METKVRQHVVRPGDTLTRVAYRHGQDPDHVWSLEENRELRSQRPDPEVLLPGDVLFVPTTPRSAGFDAVAGDRITFTARPRRLALRLRFVDPAGLPAAGTRYEVHGLPAMLDGTTDAAGVAAFEVPLDTESVLVHLPALGVWCPTRVGHLDPVSAPSGLAQRLAHLGYLPGGTQARGAALADRALRAAVGAFQATVGLPVTGAADDATRAKLVETHGR